MATDKNVTKPRAAKAAQTIDMTPIEAPEQVDQVAGTATEAPAPEQIDAPPVSETLTPTDVPLGDGKAADTAAEFKEELKVPAPPAPLTPLQVHSAGFAGDLKSALLAFLKCRPVVEAAWTEPTKEEIKARRLAHFAAHPELDVTDMDAHVEVGMMIMDAVATERAAHAAASKDVDQVTRAYYAAALNTLTDFRATMLIAYEKVGGQVAPPATTKASKKTPAAVADAKNESTARTVSATAAEKAAKRVAYVQSKGLPHYDVIDKTIGGYEAEYHALRLHVDGRWEKLLITVDANDRPTGEFTATGEFVSTPIYWKNTTGEKPQYSLHQMFGIWDPNHLLERPFTTADGKLAKNGYLAMIDLVHSDIG